MTTHSLQDLLAPQEQLTIEDAIESFLGVARMLRTQPPAELTWMLDGLEKNDLLREQMRLRAAKIVEEATAVRLFAETGLPSDRGFLVGTLECLSRKVLPTASRARDIGDLLARMFPSIDDAGWIESLSADQCERLARIITPAQSEDRRSPWRKLRTECCDAVELLSLRVASWGLSDEVHSHSGALSLQASPFHRLMVECQGLLVAFRGDDSAADTRLDKCVEMAVACRSTLNRVMDGLERSGVSVAVVHRVDLISKSLNRITTLLKLLRKLHGGPTPQVGFNFLAALVRHRVRDESFRELCRSNLRLLARRIVESASARGEHYITTNWREYQMMFFAACGGGLLTAFTTLAKYKISALEMAPLVEGIVTSINYAVSFLLIQALGFMLATKQPSHTAAALAHVLSEESSPRVNERLVSLVARIARSQIAAVTGNIVAAVPAAIVLNGLYLRATGNHFLDAEKARYVIHSLDPIHSLTLLYAAMAGVFLWLSSLCAGYLENWAFYRRLPQAIAEHRLARRFGQKPFHWLARVVHKNTAGFGGNVSLGFFLGLTPILGKFTGLPLDVRHVTLSTAALTLAAVSMGPDIVQGWEFWRAVIGIFCIGLLNVWVAFGLSLVVALRARDARFLSVWSVLRTVLREALRRPSAFLWPRRNESTPAHAAIAEPD